MRYLAAVLRVLGDRNVILALAFLLGLLLGESVSGATQLALPALGLIMTVSSSQVPSSVLLRWRRLGLPLFLAVFYSYLINGGVTLLLASLLIQDPDLWPGFVLVAAAPPGVTVLAFTSILDGDTTLSLVGTAGAYVAALLIAPLMAQLLIGPGLIQPGQLFIILVQLVVIPLIVSRVLRRRELVPYVDRWREPVVNWGLFVVFLGVVGVNRDVFLSEPGTVGLTAAVALATVFGLGFLVGYLLRWSGVRRSRGISLALFASLKNSGFAAATALALLSARGSVPGAVVTAVIGLYLIWLGLRGAPGHE